VCENLTDYGLAKNTSFGEMMMIFGEINVYFGEIIITIGEIPST
jgi:hypothetical protein